MKCRSALLLLPALAAAMLLCPNSSLGDEDGAWTPLVMGARFDPVAIYDPLRDRVLMDGTTNIWALPLSEGTHKWTEIVAVGAPQRAWHGVSAIYDSARDRILIFGGFGSYPNDVWALTLSGTPTWSEVTTAGPRPFGRKGAAAIYDPVRDRMIVMGGCQDLHYFSDAWALTLSGTSMWSELPSGHMSSEGHSAIYDPLRDRVVVFGGHFFEPGHGGIGNVWSNQVSELRLSAEPEWRVVTPSGPWPAERYEHSAIYDPVRDRMLVFAGGGAGPRDDVWALTFSGTPEWHEQTPGGSRPIGRLYHGATYDPLRDRMLVFGGLNETTNLSDLWELALAPELTWNALPPGGVPPPKRSGCTSIHDPLRDRMVVFGAAIRRYTIRCVIA